MTAVANPPSFPPNLNRPGWGINGHAMNSDESRGMFAPRKNIQRTNSSSSIASNSSTSSSSTLVSTNGSTNGAPVSAAGDLSGWPRKRPPTKGQWVTSGKPEAQGDFSQLPNPRPQLTNALNGAPQMRQTGGPISAQGQLGAQNGISRPMGSLGEPGPAGQPVLYLLSLNGTFERKTISVPYQPETLRIGRQTNAKTVPTPANGYFDSKVLSRQHAEIWADRQGKIWIRDVKSSNGTFVNGARLSAENRESEPHELQTSDHLELGIDIVSEDQKSVVHHKVAAKVEHAGILAPSSNLLDMSFGDLDPANGSLMMPQAGNVRGRPIQAMNSNPRMGPAANVNAQQAGMGLQRGFAMTTGPSTEAIVKKLHQEMRNARLQAQNLARTQQFINTLLSKDDIKNEQKPEVPSPPKGQHLVNGNAVSFTSNSKPTRFSDPPAPPPQQPLPEKPDRSGDNPSLIRSITERPKSIPPPGAANTSPVRQENFSQILQLTEALNNAKREIDTQHAKMRDLEEMLLKERQARESAEELARKLEDAAAMMQMNGIANAPSSEVIVDALVPGVKSLQITKPEEALEDMSADRGTAPVPTPLMEAIESRARQQQAQIDTMATEIKSLNTHLEEWQQRAQKAEAERDADRETLAEMVRKIQQRDEAEAARQEAERARSLSRSRRKAAAAAAAAAAVVAGKSSESSLDGTSDGTRSRGSTDEPPESLPTLSRSNTITPGQGELTKASRDSPLVQGIPYASMIGVVLIGMGLMAYLNGWQPEPPRASR